MVLLTLGRSTAPSGGSALSAPPSSLTQGPGPGLESTGSRDTAAAVPSSSAADDGRGKEAQSTGDSRSQFNFSKPLFSSSCCSFHFDTADPSSRRDLQQKDPEPTQQVMADQGGSSGGGNANGAGDEGVGTGGKAPSVLSADTSKSQGPAAWYYPWAWYGSGSAPPGPPNEGDGAHGDEGDDLRGHSKTESEIVKEEALARDDPSSTAAAPESQELTLRGQADTAADLGAKAQDAKPTIQEALIAASTNPIETSFATNRTGWASFFMSRALLMKSITDGSEEKIERDENGMEVMDIDEEDDGATPPSAATGKEMILRPPQAQLLPSISPPKTPLSPSPPLKREPKKSDPPAPPLTNSEAIKREVSKGKGNGVNARAPSPAPSKRSGYASPTPSQNQKTQTPNLVLPTWSDTFHTPPRSFVPPPPPPKAGPSTVRDKISGAVKFVGGMLFAHGPKVGEDHAHAQTAHHPSHQPPSHLGHGGSGKGKERESSFAEREDLLLFGKELPKALDVLGQNMDETLLNGECRVVVIGVAGWSPGLFSFSKENQTAGDFLTAFMFYRRCDKNDCGWCKSPSCRALLTLRCSLISFWGRCSFLHRVASSSA